MYYKKIEELNEAQREKNSHNSTIQRETVCYHPFMNTFHSFTYAHIHIFVASSYPDL